MHTWKSSFHQTFPVVSGSLQNFKTKDRSVDLVFLNKAKNHGNGRAAEISFLVSVSVCTHTPASPPQTARLLEDACDGFSFLPGCFQDGHLDAGKVGGSRVLPSTGQHGAAGVCGLVLRRNDFSALRHLKGVGLMGETLSGAG